MSMHMMSIMIVIFVLKIRYYLIQQQTEKGTENTKVVVVIVQAAHQGINVQKVKNT